MPVRLAALLAALFACLVMPAAAPAAQDWNRVIVATPEGGWRIGNPQAKTKLIEYGSYTCPHCAHFAAEGWPALRKDRIAKGNLSLEFRQFVLNPVDLAAGMAVRCNAAPMAMKLTEAIFADQKSAFGEGYDAEQAQRISALPESRQFSEIARLVGLDKFLVAHGMPAAKVSACLVDLKARDRIIAILGDGSKRYAITGTPSFVLDGKLVPDTFSWDVLAPKLPSAK